MTATTTSPAPLKTGRQPFTTLHYINGPDLLNAQVYGEPARALCGDEFVPVSGDAENGTAGGPNAVICPECQERYDNLPRRRWT